MGLYFDYAYTFDSLTLAVPFLLALAIFYLTYSCCFKRFSARIRTKKLVSR
jgi:hypothetical protein